MISEITPIAEHLYALKTYFSPNETDGPYVVSYLALGRVAVLFDSGLRSTAADVLALLERLGRPASDLRLIINSHAHFDHIGANGLLKEATGCLIVAEPSGVGWIEDHRRQYREFYEAFPDAWTPTAEETRLFFEWLGPETSVEVQPNGAFALALGEGVVLDVFPTPGHISSCVSALDRGTGAMITGDSFQAQGFFGNLPQYDSVSSYQSSLFTYGEHVPGRMYTAHTPPLDHEDAASAVRSSAQMVEEIGESVLRTLRRRGQPTHLRDVGASICDRFQRTYNIQALCTVDAHLRDLAARDLIRRVDSGTNVWLA